MNKVKTHEIQLNTSAFNQFANIDYIILEADNILENDYVLFKQVETIENEPIETGLHRMTQVKQVIRNTGLKDGYILVVVNKL